MNAHTLTEKLGKATPVTREYFEALPPVVDDLHNEQGELIGHDTKDYRAAATRARWEAHQSQVDADAYNTARDNWVKQNL